MVCETWFNQTSETLLLPSIKKNCINYQTNKMISAKSENLKVVFKVLSRWRHVMQPDGISPRVLKPCAKQLDPSALIFSRVHWPTLSFQSVSNRLLSNCGHFCPLLTASFMNPWTLFSFMLNKQINAWHHFSNLASSPWAVHIYTGMCVLIYCPQLHLQNYKYAKPGLKTPRAE